MNTNKVIIGRQYDHRPEFTRTLPDHAKRLPWKHDIDRMKQIKEDAKHWAVIAGLVGCVAIVWFVLPWGGR